MEATRKVSILLLGITAVVICQESAAGVEGQKASSDCKKSLDLFLEAWNKYIDKTPTRLGDIIITQAQDGASDAAPFTLSNGNISKLRNMKHDNKDEIICVTSSRNSDITINATISSGFSEDYLYQPVGGHNIQSAKVYAQLTSFQAIIVGAISRNQATVKNIEQVILKTYDVITPEETAIPPSKWDPIKDQVASRMREEIIDGIQKTPTFTEEVSLAEESSPPNNKEDELPEACTRANKNDRKDCDCMITEYMKDDIENRCKKGASDRAEFCDNMKVNLGSICP